DRRVRDELAGRGAQGELVVRVGRGRGSEVRGLAARVRSEDFPMQSQNRKLVSHPASRRRRGLSIIEVMISLTISAFLLVAVAAAYSASADAVEMNDKFFRATQAGRVTMNQVLTEIRRADAVQVFTDHID